LNQIAGFEEKFRAILGVNEKEAYQIAALFDIYPEQSLPPIPRLETLAAAVYEKLGIHGFVIHPTRFAVVCTSQGVFHAEGPYCEKPVLTTGAGDNFNGGFCTAYALGLSPASALYSGVATSGFYVRKARSPVMDELIAFLREWQAGGLQ